MSRSFVTLWSWATRDLLRRPVEAALSGLALATLVTVLAVNLLATQGLSATVDEVLDAGPSLLVRRVGPGGWLPMPAGARDRALAVRGVTRALARSWGVVRWQEQALTVLATDGGDESVAPGVATIGPGVDLNPGDALFLEGLVSRSLRVHERLGESTGIVAHDLILVSEPDARALLGLGPAETSDLALWVYHDSEVDAVRPALREAFPFPVRIVSAREARGALRSRLERVAGLGATLLIPGLLALALLALAVARSQSASRRDVGLLKALGWRSADIVRLHLYRALVIGLPGVALGWASGYALVFLPELQWLGGALLAWTGPAPQLRLDPAGAIVTLLEIGALVLGPWVAAFVLPAARSASVDAEQWLRGEGVG
jgi:hypothetical protein